VFNNGVFQSEIYPPAETRSAFPSHWLVVGNPSKRKGWEDFFAALSKLHEANRLGPVRKIVFTGVPSEDESAKYGALCRQFSTEISLEFLPFFANLGEACQNFDLIIQPSRSESFGMALLEACCAGRCVISSKTGVAEKLILNSNLLFEPGKVDGLSTCLDYVLTNWQSMKDDREETLQIVRENFSTENNTERVISLYQQMLSESRRSA
jgi:glycosyltransferase involved in cell wall biosynthesis